MFASTTIDYCMYSFVLKLLPFDPLCPIHLRSTLYSFERVRISDPDSSNQLIPGHKDSTLNRSVYYVPYWRRHPTSLHIVLPPSLPLYNLRLVKYTVCWRRRAGFKGVKETHLSGLPLTWGKTPATRCFRPSLDRGMLL